ncbi:hypothetical protein O3P69_020633 [Scylla paramamosain]|uniref:Methyltransferase domain-containing protein n=1 Tax=Scylla paramamosain TaxID=85552 RepID=A0AAW0TM10_SCYPA
MKTTNVMKGAVVTVSVVAFVVLFAYEQGSSQGCSVLIEDTISSSRIQDAPDCGGVGVDIIDIKPFSPKTNKYKYTMCWSSSLDESPIVILGSTGLSKHTEAVEMRYLCDQSQRCGLDESQRSLNVCRDVVKSTSVWRTKVLQGSNTSSSIFIERISSAPQCRVPGLQSIEQYRAYLHNTEITCKNLKPFGGKRPAPKAGMKMVCLDDKFNIRPGNCVVFSFGVGNEWSFEDEFDKFGCKVYAYDPTMGKKDHQRSPNIKFFATGIGSFNGTRNVGMGKKWSMQNVRRWLYRDCGLNIQHTYI